MEAFLQRAGITYLTPACGDDFDRIQHSYTGLHRASQPAIITLPDTPEHVAATVKQCIATNHSFVVRGGGHDCHGRFTTAGALSIDLRRLNSIAIAADNATARIGGGTTVFQFLAELENHGLQAASGVCGYVGYAGWCLIGGLGPWSTIYGIGSDQIKGATVVNAHGELVEADERLLSGLRGGGGSLAIVVELAVKVYPMQAVRSVTITYETENSPKTVSTFFSNLGNLLQNNSVPTELFIQSYYLNEGLEGPLLAVDVVWNGEITPEYNLWIRCIAKLAPLRKGSPDPGTAIEQTTVRGFVEDNTRHLPPTVVGRTHAVSITHFSHLVAEVLAEMAAALPTTSVGGFNTHTICKESPSCSPGHPDSVAPYRKPQIVFEMLGFGVDEESAPACAEWALELRDKLAATDVALPASYLALTAPEFVDLEKLYGHRLEKLKRLKKEYDPCGVFCNTLPNLV